VAIDPNDPATLAARDHQAKVASQHFGVTVSPLRKEEAEAIGRAYDAADADTAVRLLGTLKDGLGEDALDLIADDVSDQRPVLALVMDLNAEAPLIARTIIVGERALRDVKEMAPSKDDVQTAAAEAFPDTTLAAVPGALNVFLRGGIALDAGRRAGRGDLTVNVAALTSAMRDVAGGPIEWNGATILPPVRGMDENDFEDLMGGIGNLELARAGGANPRYADGTPFTPAELEDAILESLGNGRYLIRMDGLGYVESDVGGAFVLDLAALIDARGRSASATKATAGTP
jgi:hypothetical protein